MPCSVSTADYDLSTVESGYNESVLTKIGLNCIVKKRDISFGSKSYYITNPLNTIYIM